MLGASPDTDEAGVRLVLSKYGEVIEASKGLISPKKLPGCSNGIWTVKLILEKDQTLPPFLIMKEEGEVWQLATGEVSVCWKCGSIGHIGDRCYQDVSALAASLVGPTISLQPSWAHVVRGGSAVPQLPQLPLPPPLPLLPPPSYKLCVPISARVILLARSKLEVVGVENRFGVDVAGVHPEFRDEYVREQLDKKAKAASLPVEKSGQLMEAMEDVAAAVDIFVAGEIISQLDESQVLIQPSDAVYSDVGTVGKEDVEKSEGSEVMVSESGSSQQHKKARLSSELVKSSDPDHISTSPTLHHKLPSGSKQYQELHDDEDQDEGGGVHTNMFGINYVMWFDLSIEGKSPMDPEEDDWGGKIEFGFGDKNFPKDLEDYFLMFEDECTTQSHSCAGRVMGVLFNMRASVLNPPSYDPRNVVDLLDKYRDGHIVDSGWREVDTEEWVTS